MSIKEITKSLQEAVSGHSFVKRGNAFFRVIGDGVLQILKFEYERCFEHHSLSIGLQSMYGEWMPQHFTSGGCIPCHSVMNYVGERTAVRTHIHGGIHYSEIVSPAEQIHVLTEHCLPVLNEIRTQQQLLNHLLELDIIQGTHVIWNDGHKIAPSLACGDMDTAEHVVQAILDQHQDALLASKRYLKPEQYMDKCRRLEEEDQIFKEIRANIQANDTAWIQDYLRKNYEANCNYARFCMKNKNANP